MQHSPLKNTCTPAASATASTTKTGTTVEGESANAVLQVPPLQQRSDKSSRETDGVTDKLVRAMVAADEPGSSRRTRQAGSVRSPQRPPRLQCLAVSSATPAEGIRESTAGSVTESPRSAKKHQKTDGLDDMERHLASSSSPPLASSPVKQSALPCVQRVRGLTAGVNTVVAATNAAARQLPFRGTTSMSLSFLGHIIDLDDASDATGSASGVSSPGVDERGPLITPSPSPALFIATSKRGMKGLLSPAAHVRRRQSVKSTSPSRAEKAVTVTGAPEGEEEEEEPVPRPMARHATVPLMSLPSMQPQRLSRVTADVSCSTLEGASPTNVTATMVGANMTISDFTLTSNAVLQRSGAAEVEDPLNGSLAPRRSNTMAALPTHLQQQRRQQQQQNDSRLRPSPPPPLCKDSMTSLKKLFVSSRATTTGLQSPLSFALFAGEGGIGRTAAAAAPGLDVTSSTGNTQKIGASPSSTTTPVAQRTARQLRFPGETDAKRELNGAREKLCAADAEEEEEEREAVMKHTGESCQTANADLRDSLMDTGDSVVLLGPATTAAGEAERALPPPLLSLTSPHTSATRNANRAEGKREESGKRPAGAPSAVAEAPSTPLVASPPTRSTLLPSRPRRSSAFNSSVSINGRRPPMVEPVLSVTEEETYELNVDDLTATDPHRRRHQPCVPTSSSTARQASVVRVSREKISSAGEMSQRKDGLVASDIREADALRPEGSASSPSNASTSSSPILLHASFDGFDVLLSAGASLVSSSSSTSAPSLSSVSPRSSKTTDGRPSAAPSAAASSVQPPQRSFRSPHVAESAGLPLLPFAAVLTEANVNPAGAAHGRRSSNGDSGSTTASSPASRTANAKMSATRTTSSLKFLTADRSTGGCSSGGGLRHSVDNPQQQQQQQRLSRASIIALSSISTGPSQSASSETSAPLPARSNTSGTHGDFVSEDSVGSPSRRGLDGLYRGHQGKSSWTGSPHALSAAAESEATAIAAATTMLKAESKKKSGEGRAAGESLGPQTASDTPSPAAAATPTARVSRHRRSPRVRSISDMRGAEASHTASSSSAGQLTPLPDSGLVHITHVTPSQEQQRQQSNPSALLMPLMLFASRDSSPVRSSQTSTAEADKGAAAAAVASDATALSVPLPPPPLPAWSKNAPTKAHRAQANAPFPQPGGQAIPTPPAQLKQQQQRRAFLSLQTIDGDESDEANSLDSPTAEAVTVGPVAANNSNNNNSAGAGSGRGVRQDSGEPSGYAFAQAPAKRTWMSTSPARLTPELTSVEWMGGLALTRGSPVEDDGMTHGDRTAAAQLAGFETRELGGRHQSGRSPSTSFSHHQQQRDLASGEALLSLVDLGGEDTSGPISASPFTNQSPATSLTPATAGALHSGSSMISSSWGMQARHGPPFNHSSTAAPIPRGPNASGGTSPLPFRSVAGLTGGVSPLPRAGEAAGRPSSIGYTAAPRNGGGDGGRLLSTPPTAMTITVTSTNASPLTAGAAAARGTVAGSVNAAFTSSPLIGTSLRGTHRAPSTFGGFAFASQSTRMASNVANASLSLPPYARSTSSPTVPHAAVTPSPTATSQLLTHRSVGSASSTSSMGAFVLHSSNTAMMMRRGVPHRMTEVSLPDQSISNRGHSTSSGSSCTTTGGGSGRGRGHRTYVDNEDEANQAEEDLMSSATHRANRRILQLSKRSTNGRVKSASYSRRGRRRSSLLKPGTAIELAILNGLYARRLSAASVCNGNGNGGGGGGGALSVMGRSGYGNGGPQSWGEMNEQLEVSLSCAASYTASSTSASATYISSSFGSVSQARLAYQPHTAADTLADSHSNNNNNGSAAQLCNMSRAAVPSSFSLLHLTVGPGNAEEDEDYVDNPSCVLYATAPRHFHFYRGKRSEETQPASSLQLPRYQQQQQQQQQQQRRPSFLADATTTMAAVQRRPREKKHHRYVRVHHRRRASNTKSHLRGNSPSPPIPNTSSMLVAAAAPATESPCHLDQSREEAHGTKLMQSNMRCDRIPTVPPAGTEVVRKETRAAAQESRGPLVGESEDTVASSASPPPASTATTSHMKTTSSQPPEQQQQQQQRAIYSPHLSTSSLLYYDDVDSDAVDDVYYQLEKRLFPVREEEALQRRCSLKEMSQSSQKVACVDAVPPASSDDKDHDSMDALFTVLDVPLRLNLRGGFHLSDYYAPCPVCHPVMQKLAAAAAVPTAVSTTSTTSTTSSSGTEGGSCESLCTCSEGSCTSLTQTEDKRAARRLHTRSSSSESLPSSPSGPSSPTAYSASTPSAMSILSSVISATGVGFAFGSGAPLTTAATPPPSQRAPAAAHAATATTTSLGMPRVSSKNSLRSGSVATTAAHPRAFSARRGGHGTTTHAASTAAAATVGNGGGNSARMNNVTIVSPNDGGEGLLTTIPSPHPTNEVLTVPCRLRGEGEGSSRRGRSGPQDTAGTATAMTAVVPEQASLAATATSATDRSFRRTGSTIRAGQPVSSILQRGGSAASTTMTTTTTSLSAMRVASADAPHQQQQQQQQYASLPSLPPFGHGQFTALSSASPSGRNSQVMALSQALMVIPAARRESRSIIAAASMSTRHLTRYRRQRQRHRPALVVARRRGYRAGGTGGGGTGTALRSQYSSFMKQRLLCIRINDKFTYIDPKRATGAAKLVADAALLAERQRRAEERRQRHRTERQCKRDERGQQRKEAAAAADTQNHSEDEGLGGELKRSKGDGVASERYCRHCHRLRHPPPGCRHRHGRGEDTAQGNAAATSSPRKRHRSHHRQGRRQRTHGLASAEASADLLSQNGSGAWETRGIAPALHTTRRGGAEDTLTVKEVGSDGNEESMRNVSAAATARHALSQQQQQQQQQQRLFGDGLACFAAQQSPAPKAPASLRTANEAALASALRRPDTTTTTTAPAILASTTVVPTRSGGLHCLVIAGDSPPRPQRGTLVSRTAGRVAHSRAQSSSSLVHSLGASRTSANAVSSLPFSVNVVARLRSSSGSDLSEAAERRERSAQGANSSEPADAAARSTAGSFGAATSMLPSANGRLLRLPREGVENSHGEPLIHQASDSALLSTYASADHLVAVDSMQVSMPHNGVTAEEGDRESEISLVGLPYCSPLSRDLEDPRGGFSAGGGGDGRHKEYSQGAGGDDGKGQSGSSGWRLHSAHSSSNYNAHARFNPRAGSALAAATSSLTVAETPYSVSSHNLQPHAFGSGCSSGSALSTPLPPYPLSPQANAQSTGDAALNGGAEGRLGSRATHRSAASLSSVLPFATPGAHVCTVFNLPSRSSSQAEMPMEESGETPRSLHRQRHHQARSRSHASHSPSHSARQRRSLTSLSHSHHCSHHHFGSSLVSAPPPEADVTEEDLLNTALAAYPDFAPRPRRATP